MSQTLGKIRSSLDEPALGLLETVHVNMPWRFLPEYRELVLDLRMNLEIGFEGIELDGVSRSEMRAAARQLHERGCRLTLHGPFWDLCPGSVEPLIRQVSRLRLHQFLDLLEIFRPVQVVCHTGFDPRHHQGHRERFLDHSLAVWEPMVARAESLGVRLLVENVWELDPTLHRALLDSLGSPFFGICLDVGHQHSFSKTPLAEWLDALSEDIREVHLHDNDGTRDAHLPIGQGSIDFGLLFERLAHWAEAPVLTLEPHLEEHLAESLAGLGRFYPTSA